jgi:hypothetical protein
MAVSGTESKWEGYTQLHIKAKALLVDEGSNNTDREKINECRSAILQVSHPRSAKVPYPQSPGASDQTPDRNRSINKALSNQNREVDLTPQPDKRLVYL